MKIMDQIHSNCHIHFRRVIPRADLALLFKVFKWQLQNRAFIAVPTFPSKLLK